jgi:hypothetical protein
MKHVSVVGSHVLFGAIAGGVYELLDDDFDEPELAAVRGR